MTKHLRNINDGNFRQELLDAIKSKNCILLAGSGLSAQACTKDGRHPPLWRGLLKGMVKWCSDEGLIDDPEYAEGICALVNEGFLIEAGQEIEEILAEKSKLQQCLREVLLCHDAQVSDAHLHIASIPFRAYLTTNYDNFIEIAYSMVSGGRSLFKCYEGSIDSVLEEYRQSRRFILKLHGDIENRDSIILGDRSYERLLHHSTSYRECLQTLFSMSSVLFIGFGGSDPDLDGLLSKVAAFDGRRSRHWIVVSEGKFPALKAKRLLKDKGISVIQYKHDEHDENHLELVKFLKALEKSLTSTRAGSEEGESLSSHWNDLELEDS